MCAFDVSITMTGRGTGAGSKTVRVLRMAWLLQGQNLTDEDTLQTNNDAREVTKYQTFGANYLLNVNYRFK